MCRWVSMKPGMTIVLDALTRVAAGALRFGPTAAMREPSISTSPTAKSPTFGSSERTQPPLSRMRPPAAGCCAAANVVSAFRRTMASTPALDARKSRRDSRFGMRKSYNPNLLMALEIGTRVGAFELTGTLGAGGMGEVYRARDSKLGRDVALKILPDHLIDADRLARFTREAQVVASLSHPNIGAIHGLEQIDGRPVLVLELVEGPTLADRIAQGPLPQDDAVSIARQIAEALEAAHEQGVVHRDLKPANVKLRPDGLVKVLDFGLAKLADQVQDDRSLRLEADQNPTMSPTITSPAMTGVGLILGTAAYMSPEQAAGKPADKRADIWSFGVVLWEMLTGRRLFGDAESTSHVLADV